MTEGSLSVEKPKREDTVTMNIIPSTLGLTCGNFKQKSDTATF